MTATCCSVGSLLAYGLFWFGKNTRQPYGLTVTYYAGEDFGERRATRTELRVSRHYGTGRPAWRVPRNRFSVRWTGYLVVPETGNYSFHADSDDGVRLFIDDCAVVDNWRLGESSTNGDIRLDKGCHAIRIEHFNAGRQAFLDVTWCGGPIPANTPLAVPYLRKRPPER